MGSLQSNKVVDSRGKSSKVDYEYVDGLVYPRKSSLILEVSYRMRKSMSTITTLPITPMKSPKAMVRSSKKSHNKAKAMSFVACLPILMPLAILGSMAIIPTIPKASTN